MFNFLPALLLLNGCDALHRSTVAIATLPSGEATVNIGQKLAFSAVINDGTSQPKVHWSLHGTGTLTNADEAVATYTPNNLAGSYIVITATSVKDPSKTADLVVGVNAAVELPELPTAQVGVPYSFLVSASKGTGLKQVHLDSGTIPGLTFDAKTSVLSGIPVQAGSFRQSYFVQDESTPGWNGYLRRTLIVTP